MDNLDRESVVMLKCVAAAAATVIGLILIAMFIFWAISGGHMMILGAIFIIFVIGGVAIEFYEEGLFD